MGVVGVLLHEVRGFLWLSTSPEFALITIC
jgi:hypothetical protein